MVLPVLLRWLAQAEAAGSSFHSWKEALGFFALLEIPVVITGCVLVLMSFGLLIKSRISWFFALLLLLAAVCIDFFIVKNPSNVTYLSLVSIAVLLYYWRRFDHYSLATGSFFAIVSLASLTVTARARLLNREEALLHAHLANTATGGTGHRQRAHHASAGFGLPPGIHNRAAFIANGCVVPVPGLGVDRLAHRTQQAQAGRRQNVTAETAAAESGLSHSVPYGKNGLDALHPGAVA